MNCEFCDKTLPPGQLACPSCGGGVSSPGPMHPAQPQVVYQPQPGMAVGPAKSKVTAGILAILLGALGIHNFYLGFTGKGLAQLLITVLTCGYGGIITGIWALVEGIQILTGSMAVDAKGQPLRD